MNGDHVSFSGFKASNGQWYEMAPYDLHKGFMNRIGILIAYGARYVVRSAVL